MNSISRAFLTQGAALCGVAMVTLGLFAWSASGALGVPADRAQTAAWSVRCFSAAAIAGGQVLFALVVVPGLFRGTTLKRGTLELAYALAMGLLALLSVVAGTALAAAAGW